MPIKGHSSIVSCVVFSPDGTKLASSSWDYTIKVWDVISDFNIINTIEGHTHIVESVMFSPDGTKIVSASDDETTRVWDIETGKQIGLPISLIGRGHFAAFNPDGTKIISASQFWEIAITNFPPIEVLVDETQERFKERQLTFAERKKYYLE